MTRFPGPFALQHTSVCCLCILQSPWHRRQVSSGDVALWCRNELLPKAFLPTKLVLALSPRGWERSCHCKVQVIPLPQYYHGNMQWAFIFPTLTITIPTQPAPLWAFHSIVFTLEHWYWLWNEISSQSSFVPLVLYTAAFSGLPALHYQVAISNSCHMGPKFCMSCTDFQPQNLEPRWSFGLSSSGIPWTRDQVDAGQCCRSASLLCDSHCPVSVSLCSALFPAWTPSPICM